MHALLRAGLFLLFFCFCAGAVAKDEKVQVGVGVVCDTSEQVEHYLTLSRSNTSPETALQIINSESKGSFACGMAAIAFMPGDQIGTVEVSGGMMRIMQITVVAMETDRGWIPVPRATQYTALFEELVDA